MGRDEFLGRDVERIGCKHQIGLVIGEKFENRALDLPVGQPLPQDGGREPGQRQQPFGSLFVGQYPCKCRKRQRVRLAGAMFGFVAVANNC